MRCAHISVVSMRVERTRKDETMIWRLYKVSVCVSDLVIIACRCIRKVEGGLVAPVVRLGIGKVGGGRLRGELLTRTIVSVVGSLSSVGGHKVRVVGPSAEGIMVYVMEIADLHGIAKGLRTRGIVAALQGKRTRKRNGASQASDLGMSVTPRHTHTHTHTRACVCVRVCVCLYVYNAVYVYNACVCIYHTHT